VIRNLRKRLVQVSEIGYDIWTFCLGLFYAWRNQEDIDKCLCDYVAEVKLREIVSSGRERIDKIIKEGEYGEIETKEDDYLQAVGERPPYKYKYTVTHEDPFFGHQYAAKAEYRDVGNAYKHYIEDNEEKKELIRIEVTVDDGGSRALSRTELLNTKDLTLYEKPL